MLCLPHGICAQATIDGCVTVRIFLAGPDGSPIRSPVAAMELANGKGGALLCLEVTHRQAPGPCVCRAPARLHAHCVLLALLVFVLWAGKPMKRSTHVPYMRACVLPALDRILRMPYVSAVGAAETYAPLRPLPSLVDTCTQVRDDGPGPGCADDEIEGLFEPFYSYHLLSASPDIGLSPRGDIARELKARSARIRASYVFPPPSPPPLPTEVAFYGFPIAQGV